MGVELIGREIDGYQIEAELGRGGMARVYRGYDPHLNRYAAIKVVDPRNEPHDFSEYRERFLREAQAVAQLRHQNIVGVYRFGQIDKTLPYIAMEYIEGATLRWVIRDYLKDDELMPNETVLSIIKDISAALDYAHARGVIHRDVKPSNIMINRQKEAILTDFGLALMASMGTEGESFGSPYYIAPEQAMSSANVVPQSDLYSLGITLYEMLTGKVPFFDGVSVQIAMAHMVEEPTDPREFNPNLHDSVAEVVMTALKKTPQERYQSGEKMYRALRQAFRDAKRDGIENPTKPRSIHLRQPVKVDAEPAPHESPIDVTIKVDKYNEAHPLPEKAAQRRNGGRGRRIGLLLLLIIVTGGGTALYLASDADLLNFASSSATGDNNADLPPNFALEGIVRGLEDDTLTVFDQIITLPDGILTANSAAGGDSVRIGDSIRVGDSVRIEGSTTEISESNIILGGVQTVTVNGTPVYPAPEDE